MMISSLRRNSFWLMFARLTAQGLAILFTALIARKLTLNDFGHFAFIASVLLVGNTFTNFGTDTLLVREIARAGKVTPLASQALALQLILSALFCTAIIFSRDKPLLLYSLALFPLAFFSVNNALFRALDRMDLFWLLSLANGVIQILAAYISLDVITLCIFLLIGQFILSIVSCIICFAFLPDFSLLPLIDIRPIVKLTLPFAALTILLVLIQRLGVLSVSSLLGDSDTGLFSSASRVVDGLKFGHYAILGALLPALSRGSPESWQNFRKAFYLLMFVSAIFAISLFIFSSPIITVLYGSEFLPAVDLLSLLGWSLLPYTISSFISYHLIARGLEVELVKATIISLAAYALLYIYFINSRGLLGSIIAALIGECLQAMIFGVFIYRATKRASDE
jgi:O-antigen/teichoic acid export membrane protein